MRSVNGCLASFVPDVLPIGPVYFPTVTPGTPYCLSAFWEQPGSRYSDYAEDSLMNLILIILVLLLLFGGGGGYYYGGPMVGTGIGGLLLVVLLIYLFMGRRGV
jgi:hypothetical protein